jgi:hypothetical protein
MPNYALRRAAAEDIQDVVMACGRHTNEIDLELDGHVDDRVRDVARPNPSPAWRELSLLPMPIKMERSARHEGSAARSPHR